MSDEDEKTRERRQRLAEGTKKFPFLGKAFGINDDGSLKTIEREKHDCPKCNGKNAYYRTQHEDTGYEEQVLTCPDCKHQKEAREICYNPGMTSASNIFWQSVKQAATGIANVINAGDPSVNGGLGSPRVGRNAMMPKTIGPVPTPENAPTPGPVAMKGAGR